MLKSMTGYGRGIKSAPMGQFTAEVQSLNRKFLEVFITLPKELQRFETDIRRWVTEAVGRGRITVKIAVQYVTQSPVNVLANISFAKQVKMACDRLAEELHLASPEILLSTLLSESKEILTYQEDWEDEELYREQIHNAVNQALNALQEMKSVEGKQLQEEIVQRIDTINTHLQKIAILAPEQTATYRKKIEKRLKEVIPEQLGNDEGVIMREVCVFAEKVDISEEITRLHSHIKQFLDTFKQNGSVGKRLEFILQEMMRESNTIASKSVDTTIIQSIIEIKTELERIREQIQNVE